MQSYTYQIAGDECSIHFPTGADDLDPFLDWVARQPVAVDTETTGLDYWSRAFQCRLVQFGTPTVAWVLRPDLHSAVVSEGLRRAPSLMMHNAPFDGLVLDATGIMALDDVLAKTTDTYILAHLLDPRAEEDGGVGHHLKTLAAEHVDRAAPDTQKALLAVFKELGLTKDTGWANIPVDHPTYVTYAGLDVLLTSRLHDKLAPLVETMGLGKLSAFEHRVQIATSHMMRRGMLLDLTYTQSLVRKLADEKAHWAGIALTHGVEKVNSTAQVSRQLIAMGEDLTETTPTGKDKVDADILLRLADIDRDLERLGAREPNPLAEAVFHAKRASKWSTSYAEAFIRDHDEQGRLHADIRSLQARTARMSISHPPLQQLPSGDGLIRRCFVPDPGMVIGGIDYKNIEMRILAALADEPTMKKAIADGVDLHDNAATLMYGPDFTKGQRKLAKVTGFGKVYGGGATTLQRQTGAPRDAVEHAIAMYDRLYPAIKRYSRYLQRVAERDLVVVSPMGRPLPVDDYRLYAATNYVVQSTARDVLAQALIELEEAGFSENLLLPVHDEVIFQAPAEDAEEVMAAMVHAMHASMGDVQIEAEGKVYGPSWGHGYGIKDEVAGGAGLEPAITGVTTRGPTTERPASDGGGGGSNPASPQVPEPGTETVSAGSGGTADPLTPKGVLWRASDGQPLKANAAPVSRQR